MIPKYKAWHMQRKKLYIVSSLMDLNDSRQGQTAILQDPNRLAKTIVVHGQKKIRKCFLSAKLTEVELLQCSYVADSENQLIYQGDIVQVQGITTLAIFRNGCFILSGYSEPCYLTVYTAVLDQLKFTIIGNSFENVELLTKVN